MNIVIDYETKRREVCDCMMGCLENTALYYNLDYQYLYRGIWVFRFDEDNSSNKPFWKRLFTPELVNSHMQLELHHGLRLLECPYEGMDFFLEILKRELQNGNPVIIFVDAFYCPWSGVYQKGSLPHYCLLTGYNEEEETVMCADPYFMQGQSPWPISELKMGIRRFYLIRVSEPIFGLEHWKQDVLLCAKDKFDNNVFESMIKLKEEIISEKTFVRELRDQNDKYSFELFYIMKYIGHSRYNHAEFLRYVAEKVCDAADLVKAAEYLEQASEIWKKIGLIFTKLAYLTKDDRIEKSLNGISEKMEEAIQRERLAAKEIVGIIEEKDERKINYNLTDTNKKRENVLEMKESENASVTKYELNWNEIAYNYNIRIQKEYKSEKNKLWKTEIERHCKEIDKKIINVLDVGTGPGFFPMLLEEEKFHITAIDKFENMLIIARRNIINRKNVNFIKMSAEELEFEDNSFDLVIVRNISYTLSEPEKAFKEWYRVLAMGGRLLIYDANWWYYLFCDEEQKKIDMYLKEYHKRTGKEHSTYEKECRMEWDSIITRPLSKVKRPEWDYKFYKGIGVDKIIIEENVGDLVNTEDEQYKSLPTPLFLVKIIKNKRG